MVAISRPWYNGSYTIAAKPIKTLEFHYTMIQFLIITVIPRAGEFSFFVFGPNNTVDEIAHQTMLHIGLVSPVHW